MLLQRFCTPRWRSSARAIGDERARAAIDDLSSGGFRELVIAAAHPPDVGGFDELLAYARTATTVPVTVECEPAWLTADVLARLAERGVNRLRLVVGGMRRRVHETVMRNPDSWQTTATGLGAACASSLEVDVLVPVLEWNKDDLVPLLEWLLALPGSLHGFYPAIPRVADVPAAARAALLDHAHIAALAADVFHLCRRWKVGHGFADHDAVWPCAAGDALNEFGTVFHESIRRQQHEPDRALARIDACNDCSLRQTCRGIAPAYVDRFGIDGLAAVPLERSSSWQLRATRGANEVDYKQISPFDNDNPGEGRTLLRINGHCQMACAFCFVDRTAPDIPLPTLIAELDRLAERHTDHVVFSGGEPTIHTELPALIGHAASLGYRTIEIQTNGVKCADADYARSLVAAGLTKATVSLHSVDGARSDAITRMPNAYPKTIAGIHNLQALGVLTQLAHVITKENYRALPTFARGVLDEFAGGAEHLSICFAIAQGISDLVYSWVIPSFTDIEPFMREALDACLEAGVGFGGLIGQGGYPPCMLGGDMRYYEGVLTKVYRSPDFDEQFYKADACAECSFDPYCIGVRRDYVRCYGDDEIRAVHIDDALLVGATPLPDRSAG